MQHPTTISNAPLGRFAVRCLWIASLLGLAVAGLHHEAQEVPDRPPAPAHAAALEGTPGATREAVMRQGNRCLKLQSEDQFAAAHDCYSEVLMLLRQVGTDSDVATVLNNQGGVLQKLGKPQEARRKYNEALAIRRVQNDRGKEAVTLNNLASLERFVGHWQEAFAHYGNALRLQQAVGDRGAEAKTQNNLGYAYLTLGALDRALPFLERSLALRRDLGDRRGQAVTLNNLAFLYHQLGLPPKAAAFRNQVLKLRRELGDRGGEARALLGLARDQRALGASAAALALLEQALTLYGETGDRPGTARALRERGELWIDLGRPREAVRDLRRTLALQREIESHTGGLPTLVALARAESHRGRTRQALSYAITAVDLLDTLRATVGSPQLRATFLSSRRLAHELHVELLMELHRQEPGEGHHRAALAAAERARARALLDVLAESEIDLAGGVGLLEKQRRDDLEGRLRLLANQQQSLARDRSRGHARREIERQIDTTLAGLDQIEAEIRRAHPEYAELVRPQPLDVETMQSLLDADTTLLYFALGDARSYLWRVTTHTVESFELPPRSTVEDEARRVHQALSVVERGAGPPPQREGERLGQMLLGAVAPRLTTGRLAVVADDALHYVPMAALPLPSGAGEPGSDLLVERAEVVNLPSVTSLRQLRRARRAVVSAPHTLAILADPVFDSSDPRLKTGGGLLDVERGHRPRQPDLRALPRLSASTLEAESIAGLLEAEEVWMALGPDAHREAVLGSSLAEFRFLHFATHGFIDSQHPALSGLMLSQFDHEGRPREGFLGLRDIYAMKLGAELVVLSGCRTALGKDLRGEGLVGLTRGFLHAGVPRVVASLWPVEDRATAELMARFYQALLEDHLPPAAALRRAQLAIRQERRWRDPYYWAGFVLQGDWRAPSFGAKKVG